MQGLFGRNHSLLQTCKHQRDKRADTAQGHILLRVPRVALGAQERIRRFARQDGGSPFKQFIGRADAKANEQDDKEQPFTRAQGRRAQQQFADE